MKVNRIFVKRDGYGLFDYIGVFAIIFLTFLLCIKLGIKDNETTAKMFMTAAFGALGVYTYSRIKKDELNAETLAGIVVAAGMIMRIGYMIYTHMFLRSHDLGSFDNKGVGHLTYIFSILEGHLPKTNEGVLYHPPLFHALAALFVKIGRLFYPEDVYKSFEFAQIINCTVACYMLMALRNFMNETELKGKYKIFALAVIAFFPNFYFMGARLNNDMIVTYCMLLCVIYTYRWYNKRDMKTMVLLALSFGIGMAAKISCGIIAIFTAPVMLYVLYKDIRAKSFKKTILQLAVFAVICFPLALWYPIRNYILFDQPFTYVQRLSLKHYTYTGATPWYKRLLYMSPLELMRQPFANVKRHDYSVPMHVIRTAVTGEFTFEGKEVGVRILIILNMLMIIASVASMVYVLVKGRELDKKQRFGFFALWLISFLSFARFNISYPYICTADFRYMPLSAVCGAVYIAYAMQRASVSGRKYVVYAEKAASALVIAWSIFGCVVYM